MGFGSIASAAISAGSSLLGGAMTASASKSIAKKQMALQKEFAQNGIRWKVADAKAAGLHPLAALGAQTTSYQPVSVGDTSMGSALSEMGQNISRSIDATLTREERREQEQQRQELLQRQLDMQDMQFFAGMEKEKAQIDAIRAQTALDLKRASVLGQPRVPAFPSFANGSISGKVNPSKSLYQDRDGLEVLPSPERSGSSQDFVTSLLPNLFYVFRNQVGPFFEGLVNGGTSDDVIYRSGQRLRYDPLRFVYRPDWVRD